jgi:hypothetical protein
MERLRFCERPEIPRSAEERAFLDDVAKLAFVEFVRAGWSPDGAASAAFRHAEAMMMRRRVDYWTDIEERTAAVAGAKP